MTSLPPADEPGRLFDPHYLGPTACGKTAVGHDPHMIQVTRAASRHTPKEVCDLAVIDDTTVLLWVNDEASHQPLLVLCRNHRAAAIFAAWQVHRQGRLISEARLLKIGPDGGAAVYSVTGHTLSACRHTSRHHPR